MEGFNDKRMSLIKNNSNILQEYNKADSSVKEIIIENNNIDLSSIFKGIEKRIEFNDAINIHDINLLYLRNNIAKKIK